MQPASLCRRAIPRGRLVSAIAAIVLLFSVQSSGQGLCPLQSPPPPLGEDAYTGQGGYVFDYVADAGAKDAVHFFQLLVRNRTTTPLTFDWENADLFRRGVGSGVEARSQCRSDGNPPNVSHGLIKYGPNTQFPGPDARFYHYQRQQTGQLMPRVPRAPAAALLFKQGSAPAQPLGNRVNFAVKWAAILETGKEYLVTFGVTAVRVGPDVKYEFSNYGEPVQIDWPQILSPAVLEAIRIQNASRTVVLNNRLALSAGKESVVLFLSGKAGPLAPLSAPLSVYTPDNLLLYRDVFTGFQFVPQ